MSRGKAKRNHKRAAAAAGARHATAKTKKQLGAS
eukprot:ctg_4394.g674